MLFRKKRIYADAAAATPLSSASKNELVRLLSLFGNAGALHSEGVEAHEALESDRESISKSIGAHADEIIFTGSGTECNNLAIAGILRPHLRGRSTVHAITSAIEHQSVLEPLRALKREGLLFTELPVNSEGLVDVKELKEAITEQTAFVSIQLVNSEIGTIQPIRDISKILRKNNKKIILHTDASQAPLWLKVGVEQLGVDLLTLDAQKVLGPKGVGALFIKRGTHIEPIILGGSHERGLRAGTPNVPLAGAFAVALEEAQAGVEERAKKVKEIRDFCIQEIKKVLPDALVHGSLIERIANNINVSVPDLEAQMAVIALNSEGIAASTRSACDIGQVDPSHVIRALGISPELAGTAIRFTFLPDITEADVKRIAQTLFDVAKRYRSDYTTARSVQK